MFNDLAWRVPHDKSRTNGQRSFDVKYALFFAAFVAMLVIADPKFFPSPIGILDLQAGFSLKADGIGGPDPSVNRADFQLIGKVIRPPLLISEVRRAETQGEVFPRRFLSNAASRTDGFAVNDERCLSFNRGRGQAGNTDSALAAS